MILPEEDSISYLPFVGIEPPPAIMGEVVVAEVIDPAMDWRPDDSRERAYQDEMRRG